MRIRNSSKPTHKVPVQDNQSPRRTTRQSFTLHKETGRPDNINKFSENSIARNLKKNVAKTIKRNIRKDLIKSDIKDLKIGVSVDSKRIVKRGQKKSPKEVSSKDFKRTVTEELKSEVSTDLKKDLTENSKETVAKDLEFNGKDLKQHLSKEEVQTNLKENVKKDVQEDALKDDLRIDHFPIPFLEVVPKKRPRNKNPTKELATTAEEETNPQNCSLDKQNPPKLAAKKKNSSQYSSSVKKSLDFVSGYCIPDELCSSGQKPFANNSFSVRLFRPVDIVLPDTCNESPSVSLELRVSLVKTTNHLGRKNYAKLKKLKKFRVQGKLVQTEQSSSGSHPHTSSSESQSRLFGSRLNNNEEPPCSLRTPKVFLKKSTRDACAVARERKSKENCTTPEALQQESSLRNRGKVCRALDFAFFTCLDVESDEVLPFKSRRSQIVVGENLLKPASNQRLNEDISSMRLPCVEQTRKYSPQSLSWNKQHTVNTQGLYCYCGTDGVWYRGMVRCVRCAQWFHERCLAPRPRNMPIVQGDTHYLFVCSLCNYGVECLKRMPLSWENFLHIALFDLTIKFERKHHDLNEEIYKFLLSNWGLYQLPRQLTTLSDEEKKLKILSVLKTSAVFERIEGQSDLWGLKELRTPPRGNFALKDGQFVSERNVLDDVIISPDIQEGDVIDLTTDTVPNPPSRCRQTNSSHQISKNCKKAKRPRPNDKQPRLNGSKQPRLNGKQPRLKDLSRSLVKSKKIGTKRLKQAKVQSLTVNTANPVCEPEAAPMFSPLLEKPLEVVKPLPFQIAKDLYEKGFPKVCVKFASVIPPRKEVVEQALAQEKSPKKRRSKPKEKTEERGPKEGSVVQNGDQKRILDCLIPTKPNYTGKNNPFDLGSAESLRKARNMICNRKLEWGDLTKSRSRIRKRKYRLNIEESRRLWKREEDDIRPDKDDHHPSIDITSHGNGAIQPSICNGHAETNGHSNGVIENGDAKVQKIDPSALAAGGKEIAGRCKSKTGDVRYFLKTVQDDRKESEP